jgi:hypothetical protein
VLVSGLQSHFRRRKVPHSLVCLILVVWYAHQTNASTESNVNHYVFARDKLRFFAYAGLQFELYNSCTELRAMGARNLRDRGFEAFFSVGDGGGGAGRRIG